MDNRKAKAVPEEIDVFGRTSSTPTYVEFELPGLEPIGNDRFRLNGVALLDLEGVINFDRLRELIGRDEADYAGDHFHTWLETRQLARVLAERIRGR